MTAAAQTALIVHGGAGRVAADERAATRAGCEQAATAGQRVLMAGGSALDAVVAAVTVLEDDPRFNAGTGAALNRDGEIELDASIMTSDELRAGAVAAIRGVENPIQLARRLLDTGPSVLLVAEGAHAFARAHGFEFVADATLITPQQRARWQAQHGTVGAVARDCHGHIAAATSTGGLWGKPPGRVGDSALIGSGTYADRDGGISCTGTGEAIIRAGLARLTATWITAGLDAPAAARRAVDWLTRELNADVGLIVIDSQGRVGYARNTEAMAVAFTVDGSIHSEL